MDTHSSFLAWRILWIEEPGRLQSIWLERVTLEWATKVLMLWNKNTPDFFYCLLEIQVYSVTLVILLIILITFLVSSLGFPLSQSHYLWKVTLSFFHFKLLFLSFLYGTARTLVQCGIEVVILHINLYPFITAMSSTSEGTLSTQI